MSNVQLSSSALERLAARRTFPLYARTSACRSLFGPVDHDELSRDMKAKLREISERDRQRWNFNFEASAPLGGDYEWEESAEETTPVFYRDSVQTGRTRALVTPVDVNPDTDSGLREPPCVDVPPGCEERLAGPAESSMPSDPCPAGNQENRADRLNSGRQTRRLVPCLRRKRSATTDTNNTHITDFFMKRKKSTETSVKSETSSCHQPSAPIPAAQTPRKRIR